MAYQLVHHLHHHPYSAQTLVSPKPFGSSHDRTSYPVLQRHNRKTYKTSRRHYNPRNIKAMARPNDQRSTNNSTSTIAVTRRSSPSNVTFVATEAKPSGILQEIIDASIKYIFSPPDNVTFKAVVTVQYNKNISSAAKIQLEIVAAELDPRTGKEKETIKTNAWTDGKVDNNDEVKFEAEIEVPLDFGEIGAVIVENDQEEEMYMKKIALGDNLTVTCNSWVHSKYDNTANRVFFPNKSYLPSQTPAGVKRLREEELIILRGDGEGERQKFERIYDYDVYNDLGDPDTDIELRRPVLGGTEIAYPRRCRTGRPPSKTDPLSESRSDYFYLPRDEAFSEVKSAAYGKDKMAVITRTLVPALLSTFTNFEFPNFTEIDLLFNQGLKVLIEEGIDLLSENVPIIKDITKDGVQVLFDVPRLMDRDRFSWLRDEEFCRQTLAGLNPYSIQLVTEWPLRSTLDPKVYGPPESAITKEIVEQQIKGVMTLEEAIKQKKLFMLDYHDLLLPYVNKVRELKGTTLYGSRTLMFLKPTDELMPIAIELTRPPANKKPQWKQVFTPSSDATGAWLWRLAKAHVLAHDSGYHQLVSHWIRTHCVTEPYVIATNRQLSAMHPIYRLLHPYFRYTMDINSEARKSLINANGTIEKGFSPGKYSMELSAVGYDLWRFDLQALPADLISRGMAVEDPNAPHGLKLAIEDYPFASDGLILWDAIKEWVTSYVNYYYPNASLVESDQELKAWWTEIQTVGHGDKKDEPWWPELKTPENLIEILTTMIWVASGHHAAVNFGQYDYAGYFPNRPAITRTKMPTEDSSDDEWKLFMNKPEQALLACLPSVVQAVTVMATLNALSSHSPDEEYIGQDIEPSWEENQNLKPSFEIFTARMMELTAIIDRRNADINLKNRTGAGLVPYELLMPVSEKAGVTGRGVPNSISI